MFEMKSSLNLCLTVPNGAVSNVALLCCTIYYTVRHVKALKDSALQGSKIKPSKLVNL